MSAVNFVGDVHGCYDELLELCKRCLFKQIEKGETIVFLGDLVDRGPKSRQCVDLVKELQEGHPNQIECIMGNHEDWHIRYREHDEKFHSKGAKNPMNMIPEHEDAFNTLTNSQVQWLKNRPVYWRGHGFLAVHGGVPKQVHHYHDFEDKNIQRITMRLRQLDAKLNMIPFSKNEEIAIKGTPWGDRYDGRLGFAVYGHQVYSEVKEHEHALGIDTGCCFGGKLTAARFKNFNSQPTFTQVPARKNYFGQSIDELS